MSLLKNNLISWASKTNVTVDDFIDTCLNAMIGVCCNVGAYSSDVPAKLRSGQGRVEVKRYSVGGDKDWREAVWYADTANLISIVSRDTVVDEWKAYMVNAGIMKYDADNNFVANRTDKILSQKDLQLAIGLFMRFMSYHVKPVYSARQVYNTAETQVVFKGNKYVTGTITVPDAEKIYGNSVPEQQLILDSDLVDNNAPGKILNYGFNPDQLMKKYTSNNPVSRCYLS